MVSVRVFVNLRVWLANLFMKLALKFSPHPVIVLLDDGDSWSGGYLWMMTPAEYEMVVYHGERPKYIMQHVCVRDPKRIVEVA